MLYESKSSLLHPPLKVFTVVLIFAFSANANRLDAATSSSVINMLAPNLETHHMERINGSINYRLYGGKKAKEDKHWLDGRGLGMQKCVRHGNCEKLSFSTCLGAKIPYEYISLDLTTFDDQRDIEEHLKKFQALRHVPKCWAVIQPFLCAVFVPKCEQINGEDMVYLPSLEMCRITSEPCRILYNTSYFPEFLRCNERNFPSKCNNDVREMKFNLSGECFDPLVAAESSASYYPMVEGCGVRCNDPLYTEDEHRQIHKLIGWLATVCLLANVFVVATFLIEWENASKYPALIVFYINLCFLIVCCGWLAQFYPGSREDIVCRKDGTLRHSEPTAGQNLSCVIIFVVVYYFLIAAMVWFVFLTYAWHLRAVGNFQEPIDKKGSCFHLVAWSLPLVLTITTLALSEVDGNSTVGICFVAYHNHAIRSGLLWGPLIVVILMGSYFVPRGVFMLSGLKPYGNYYINSTLASNKIHDINVRMGLCAAVTLIFIAVAFACHAYEFLYSQEWSESLNEYIICRIFSSFNEHIQCKIEKRPSFSILQLNLLCLFGSGITMSSWCWRSSSLDTWKHWIRKKCGKSIQGEVKTRKHKVIAQTWAKRKELENKGRLSITLCNTYTDPVGLNFDAYDIKSSETVEISSTWANYLPKFVKRRMALTLANNSSSQGPRKSSLDSEISFSVRHVSVESRRNSVDSQVSVKIAEMKTKVASRTTTRQNGHSHSKRSSNISKRNQRRKDFVAALERKTRGRRESSTSIESQVIALKKTIYPTTSQKVGVFTKSSTKRHGKGNSKRRIGNTNTTDIDEFLARIANGYFQNHALDSSLDDETSSHSAFKMLKHDTETDPNPSDRSNEALQIEEIYEHQVENDLPKKKPTTLEELIELQKSNDYTNQRTSRNSVRSKQSRKSPSNAGGGGSYTKKRNLRRQRNISKHKTLLKVNDDKALLKISDINLNLQRENGNDSINMSQSYSELDIPLDVMLNSSDKPNSRTSKISCDVGIQTNTYGIENISDNYDDDKENYDKESKNHIKSEKDKNNERKTLLKHKPKETIVILSESEKLKMLLLPSK
uniref:Protein smoothened n=1 Tax=Glossina brevipalpis TaxID=37001 RepID=A0A1A9WK74_9MUSC